MSQHQYIGQDNLNKRLSAETNSFQEKHHAYEQGMEMLALNVQGKVILPRDPAYEDARRVWNGAFDCHPAAIVRCLQHHVRSQFFETLSE